MSKFVEEINNSVERVSVLPIEENVEDNSKNVEGNNNRNRGIIYLLPNLFTTAALFSGFYAIINGISSKFTHAAIAIFVAILFDFLDGRIARLTNTQSVFGAEYDSLSDMVAFGVAPALVAFEWALYSVGKVGFIISFIYVAAAALRLARFNAYYTKVKNLNNINKRYFIGLASPAAAAVVAGTVWSCNDCGITGDSISILMIILLSYTGILMLSNIKYYSFKQFYVYGRFQFLSIFILILVFSIIVIDPPIILLFIFLTYSVTGPILHFRNKFIEKSNKIL